MKILVLKVNLPTLHKRDYSNTFSFLAAAVSNTKAINKLGCLNSVTVSLQEGYKRLSSCQGKLQPELQPAL